VALRILNSAGYQVVAVENGDLACREAAKENFDLAILDMVMPGMPCREVVQRLRALRPNLPILLASGYAAGENVASLARDEQLELLKKPYDPDQVLRAVRAILDGAAPPSSES
jgi:two-component system, cell cycle sensor histidine kinase and response regulator CckA